MNFWDQSTERLEHSTPLECFGTVTRETRAVLHRDRLEKQHFLRAVPLRPGVRALDLGGGAGRFALWLAPKVKEVTLVDSSANLLGVAAERARHDGIENVHLIHGSALECALEGPFDLILVMGLATHLDDADVDRLVERCDRLLSPDGVVVIKEPVTTNGSLRSDDRYDAQGERIYRAWFRPRGYYTERFAPRFRQTYCQPTLAHLIPRFVDGTSGSAHLLQDSSSGQLLDAVLPLVAPLDPYLQLIEDWMRARPLTAKLLAKVDVVQDLHVFAPRSPVAVGAGVDLSVVVIAFNEQECIAPTTHELVDALDRAAIAFEIILVDDGSTDGTLAHMRDMAERDRRLRVVALQPNRGIGGALRAGFDAAVGQHITWVPADGQIAPEVVVDLFARRREAAMVTTVYASRDDAWYRAHISRTLNRVAAWRTGQTVKSGGNYLFSKAAWEQHGPRDDDSMMISTRFRKNLRDAGEAIAEMSIAARRRRAGTSKVLNARTIGRTLMATLGIKR